MAEFDINQLELDVALGAKKLLGTMTVEDIKRINECAATIMIWVYKLFLIFDSVIVFLFIIYINLVFIFSKYYSDLL